MATKNIAMNLKGHLIDTSLPIIVSYGLGVDSTALLVALKNEGIVPDAILHADVGNEFPETYAYKPVIDQWLKTVGFPPITVVRYIPKKFKHGRYSTLYGNMVRNKTLPSIAFGRKGCSMKWKGQPLDSWVRKQYPNQVVQRLIGYDAGTKDQKRCGGVAEANSGFNKWLYPLVTLGWDRERCKLEIANSGLLVPHKSSCFFCSAMSKDEVSELARTHPNLARLAMDMERVAKPNLRVIEGLWGKGIKGSRNPEAKRPGSWSEFINGRPTEETT